MKPIMFVTDDVQRTVRDLRTRMRTFDKTRLSGTFEGEKPFVICASHSDRWKGLEVSHVTFHGSIPEHIRKSALARVR